MRHVKPPSCAELRAALHFEVNSHENKQSPGTNDDKARENEKLTLLRPYCYISKIDLISQKYLRLKVNLTREKAF